MRKAGDTIMVMDVAASQVGGALAAAGNSGANGAWWVPGAALAAVGAGAAMGPSLFPRDAKMQAIAVGASAALGFAAGTIVQGGVMGLDALLPGGRMTALGVVAGVGAAVAGAITLMHPHATGKWAMARTAGMIAAAAGVAGLASTALARSNTPLDGTMGQLAVVGVAGATMLAISLMDRRAVSGAAFRLPDVNLPAVDQNVQLLDAKGALKSGTDLMPGVSNVRYDMFQRNGIRFLAERTTAAEITRVMGEARAEPVRIYVAMDEAPAGLNEPQLVDWLTTTAIDRIKQAGIRSNVTVAATTSAGYVNPIVPMSQEMMTRGDHLTVAIQAGHRKAMQELKNFDRAADIQTALMTKLNAYFETLPAAERPALNVYGESFGALTNQNALKDGISALDHFGIDRAMYVGSPLGAPLQDKLATDPRLIGGDNPLVAFMRNGREIDNLTPEKAESLRVTLLRHDADPVALFTPKLLWEDPTWLSGSVRGEGISKNQRWIPFVTGIQTGLDQQAAQYFAPGVLESKGHDYRLELTKAMARAFDHSEVTDLQLARIREFGRQAEVRWAQLADSIPSHPLPKADLF